MNAPASRETFRTSRLLDFASERELTAQIGHRPEQWPQVAVKELVDNSLDACEEAGVAPRDRGRGRPRRDQGRRQRPRHRRRRGRGRPRLLGPGLEPRGLRRPDPRRPGQRAQDRPRHAVRARRRGRARRDREPGHQARDRLRHRPHRPGAPRRAPPLALSCKNRGRRHARVAGFIKLNPARIRAAHRARSLQVRDLQPAPAPDGADRRRGRGSTSRRHGLAGGGGRPSRRRRTGTTSTASSGWSRPRSTATGSSAGCAPSASWWPGSAG